MDEVKEVVERVKGAQRLRESHHQGTVDEFVAVRIADRDALLAHLSRQEAELRHSLEAVAEGYARAEAAELALERALVAISGLVERACDGLDALDSETNDPAAGEFAMKIGRDLQRGLAELEKHTSDLGRPMPAACGASAPSAAASDDGGREP